MWFKKKNQRYTKYFTKKLDDDQLLEKDRKFMRAVDEALKDQPRGVEVHFKCPFCGEEACAESSPYNGHKRAKCAKCKIVIME